MVSKIWMVIMATLLVATTLFASENNAADKFKFQKLANEIAATQNKWLLSRRHTAIVVLDNKIYVSTNKGILVSHGTGSNDDFHYMKNIGDDSRDQKVNTLIADNNTLYAGTANGIIFSNNGGKTWVRKLISKNVLSNYVTSIFIANDSYYIGTRNGLFILSENWQVLQHLTFGSGLTANVINSVYVDKDTIYVGTPVGWGVSFDKGKNWQNYHVGDTITNSVVNVIVGDENMVYASSLDDLFISSDKDRTWQSYKIQNVEHNNIIYAISVAKDVVYLGTTEGIMVSYNRGLSWHSIPTDSAVTALYPLGSDLYVSTNDHIATLAQQTLQLSDSQTQDDKTVVMVLVIFGVFVLIVLLVYIIFVTTLFRSLLRVPRQFRISAGWVWMLLVPLINVLFYFVICYAALPNAFRRYVKHIKGDNKALLTKITKLKALGLTFAFFLLATGILGVLERASTMPNLSHLLFMVKFLVSILGSIIFILYWVNVAMINKMLPKTAEA